MPKLPTEDSLSAVVPRPSRGFVDIEPAPLDRSWEGLGALGQLIDKEFERIEDLRVNDALNQLRERRIELSVGENGFSQKKGAAVVDEPVLDNFQSAFSREIDTLGGSLQTNRARQAFQQRAAAELNAYRMDLIRHVSAQTEAYQEAVFAATLETGARTLALQASKPAETFDEVARLSDAIEQELDRRGYAAGTPEAEKVREAFRQEALGGALSSAISLLIEEERLSDAQRIFNEYEKMGAFSAKQIAAIKPKLQAAKDWAVGASLGEEAFAMRQAGKSAVEVEKFLNSRARSASELNAARVAYGRLDSAKNAEYEQAHEAMLREMVAGKSWGELRPKYVSLLAPDTVLAYDKESREGATKTDPDLYLTLSDMYATDREAFLEVPLSRYRGSLSASDYNMFVGLRRKALAGEDAGKMEQTRIQFVSTVAATQGFNKNQQKMFDTWLAMKVEEERAAGRPVDAAAMQRLAAKGLEKVDFIEGGLWNSNERKPRYIVEIETSPIGSKQGKWRLPDTPVNMEEAKKARTAPPVKVPALGPVSAPAGSDVPTAPTGLGPQTLPNGKPVPEMPDWFADELRRRPQYRNATYGELYNIWVRYQIRLSAGK